MNNQSKDPFKEEKLKQLQLWFYLRPFIGIFQSFWTLYQNKATNKEKSVSRLSLNLGLSWLLIYSLFWLGSFSTSSEILSFRLLFGNSLLTSGYFIISFILMIQVWQGKKPSFSGMENIALRERQKAKGKSQI